MRVAKKIAICLALVGIGWMAGHAQAVNPDFTLAIVAPSGSTRIACTRGCELQGGRDAGNPRNRPVPTYQFNCTAVEKCEAIVSGWVRP